MAKRLSTADSILFRQSVAEWSDISEQSGTDEPNNLSNFKQLALFLSQDIVPNDYLVPVDASSYLLFNRHLPEKTLRKLRQGQYNSSKLLDLHGCTVAQAADTLIEFLAHCILQQHTVIKLIHGKGAKSIIKTQVNHWLQHCPAVLAFCSAVSKDGGTGALYVFLKKSSTFLTDLQANN